MLSPKVSVIVPVYNVEKYIEKCVHSLFGQTFPFLEYIFVDDCSPDHSVDIIKSVLDKYPNRQKQCHFCYLKENSGPATARNIGLECAKGRYIYFCDADDWLDLSMLEKMYLLAEKENADIVISDFYIIYSNAKNYCRVTPWSLDKKVSIRNYIKKEFNNVWNLLVRKDLYRDNKLTFIAGYKCAEDLNLSVKLFYKSKKSINLHEPLYYYNRINEDSIISQLNEKTLSDERDMCLELLEWFEKEKELENYDDVLYWRILKGKQEYLLDKKTYRKFIEIVSESNQYILTCPYYNIKQKIMGWCLTHHMAFVSLFLLCLRNLKLRYIYHKD